MTELFLNQFKASDIYKTTITPPVGGSQIVYLTKDISFTVVSEWSAMCGQPGAALPGITAITGQTALSQTLSTQVFQGSSPMDITLDFAFIAVDDSEMDVILPAKTIMSWVMPENNNALLKTNYNKLTNTYASISNNYLDIDRWLIATNCTANFSNTLTDDGQPIRCDMSLTFKTKMLVTVTDFLAWFPT